MKFLHDPPETEVPARSSTAQANSKPIPFAVSRTACRNSRCVEGVEEKWSWIFDKGFRPFTGVHIPHQISEYGTSISDTGTKLQDKHRLGSSRRVLSFRNNPTRSGRLWNAATRHSKRIDRG